MMTADSSQTRTWEFEGSGSYLAHPLARAEADSERLLTLSAFCVVSLRLCASLPRICHWPFWLISANCLGLKPPAAMTDA